MERVNRQQINLFLIMNNWLDVFFSLVAKEISPITLAICIQHTNGISTTAPESLSINDRANCWDCNMSRRHDISNNVVCAISKASDQSVHTCSLIRAFAIRSLEYSMNIKLGLLTEHHLEKLQINLKRGCTVSSESTLVKRPNCWKSRVTAQLYSH